MIEYPWFGLADGADLEQGDLIASCPFDRVEAAGEADRKTFDVIVLSQSCDLANGKLELVQVCPYWSLEVFAQKSEVFRGKRGREELRRGNLPGYHLLNRCELPAMPTDFLVANFRMQFAIEFATMKTLASSQRPRLRLWPPYREHLAQALARFYMRVGLPIDIPSF